MLALIFFLNEFCTGVLLLLLKESMTFEPLIDFKQNRYGSLGILQKLLVLKVLFQLS